MPPEKNYIDILQQCIDTAKTRQEQYGEATNSIKLGCHLLSNMFGIELTPKEYCLVLVSLKLSRERYQHKEDNIIDAINYLAISLNC